MNPNIFVCEPGWEDVLAEELAESFAGVTILAPGWVTAVAALESPPPTTAPPIAFATQVLPSAAAIAAESISAWVDAIGQEIVRRLAQHSGPWRLHVFNTPAPGGNAGARRCILARQGVLEWLRKKQRRLLRTLVDNDRAAWRPNEAIAQAGMLAPDRGYLSTALPEDRHVWRRIISRFPGGRVDVAIDPQAPARAIAKVLEAQQHLGREIAPDETCVDLGASPGSWTYAAVSAGGLVTAVDRSPLRSDLMGHVNVTFQRGDAFAFKPPEPVDWLLCDVIAFPQRSAELLETWLTRRWCRAFCLTIKFRGQGQAEQLRPVKAVLAASSADYLLRRLGANKNEATAVGLLRDTTSAS